jgi:(1->4)-alpha-D-glucan 1-alpha-D-glucosylmutase
MIPRATYRLQFHKDFTFADAAAQADYFAALGISHIYASPILTARAGSRHGYDVVDHGRLNPELGGEEGFRALASALKARELGIIVDIVPNHLAVGRADNPWWLDVLANGKASAYADSFDIDWQAPGLEGKVLAPFLDGDPRRLMEKGELHLARDRAGWAFRYFEHRFPLRPEDQRMPETEAGDRARQLALLARQHFVLADWREADARINWRRFFDITDLAAIRVEQPAVFEAVHAPIFALYGEGLIDGVRVDHIDGLADPAAYCRLLRERLRALGREPYLLVEKILAEDEALPAGWNCDGTTGYDFMDEVSAWQHDSAGGGTLDRMWRREGGSRDFEEVEIEARREILRGSFAAQAAAATRAFARLLPHIAPPQLESAIAEIIARLRRYRDYATGRPDSPGPGAHFFQAVERAIADAPALSHAIASVAALFAGRSGEEALTEALRRFHQLSAPVAAKAVEDTAMYRYGRLLSRNDVGFDPRTLSTTNEVFHARMQQRARHLPAAMLTTATHDHKRGEDARARLAVLSEAPALWQAFVDTAEMPAGLDPGDVYQLYQTLLGAWPHETPQKAPDETLAERIAGWCEKFLREGKQRSSWRAPDVGYEKLFADHARHLILSAQAAPFRQRLAGLLAAIGPAAEANALVQVVLRYTVPGVPDLYQGCEFADFSLVDPDNRRPVDFARRAEALTGPPQTWPARKQRAIVHLLAARKADPDLWRLGDYRPLPQGGEQLIAFSRNHGRCRLTVLARRHLYAGAALAGRIEESGTELLSGRRLAPGGTALPDLLQAFPAAVIHAQGQA